MTEEKAVQKNMKQRHHGASCSQEPAGSRAQLRSSSLTSYRIGGQRLCSLDTQALNWTGVVFSLPFSSTRNYLIDSVASKLRSLESFLHHVAFNILFMCIANGLLLNLKTAVQWWGEKKRINKRPSSNGYSAEDQYVISC